MQVPLFKKLILLLGLLILHFSNSSSPTPNSVPSNDGSASHWTHKFCQGRPNFLKSFPYYSVISCSDNHLKIIDTSAKPSRLVPILPTNDFAKEFVKDCNEMSSSTNQKLLGCVFQSDSDMKLKTASLKVFDVTALPSPINVWDQRLDFDNEDVKVTSCLNEKTLKISANEDHIHINFCEQSINRILILDMPHAMNPRILHGGGTSRNIQPLENDFSFATVQSTFPTPSRGFIHVSAGLEHVLATHSSGSLYSWGKNNFGQLGDGTTLSRSSPAKVLSTGVLNGKKIVKAAGVGYGSAAIDSNGQVYTWGFGAALGDGTTNPKSSAVAVDSSGVLLNKKIVDICGGEEHVLLLDDQGSVFGFGSNNGQLGDSTTTPRTLPVVVGAGVLSGKTIVTISCGSRHSIALDSSGIVYSFGENFYYQLGDGTSTTRPIPQVVGGLISGKSISTVFASYYTSFAIDPAGVVYGWGKNEDYQLGDSTRTPRNFPTKALLSYFSDPGNITLIRGGSTNTLAVNDKGNLFVCGTAAFGQNGDYSLGFSGILKDISNYGEIKGKKIFKIASTTYTSVVLDTDGVIYHFGKDAYSSGPIAVHCPTDYGGAGCLFPICYGFFGSSACSSRGNCSAPDVCSCETGYLTNNCGLTSCFGKLSNDSTVCSGALRGSCTSYQNCACTTGHGGEQCHLDICFGILSNRTSKVCSGKGICTAPDTCECRKGFEGSNCEIEIKIAPKSLFNTTLACAGDAFTLNVDNSVDSNSTVLQSIWGFGQNTYGQLGISPATSSKVNQPISIKTNLKIKSLACGSNHALFINELGIIYSWGKNSDGQTAQPKSLNIVYPPYPVSMSWNTSEIPAPIFTDVAAGNSHSLALDTAGNCWVFGRNTFGALGIGSTNYTTVNYNPTALNANTAFGSATRKIVSISCGLYHSLALSNDNILFSWGLNDDGQLGDSTIATKEAPIQIPKAGLLAGKTISKIYARYNSSFLITSDGLLFGWGNNAFGQLGDDSFVSRQSPVLLNGAGTPLEGAVIASISAGADFSIVLAQNTSIFSTGNNQFGQLGDGTTISRKKHSIVKKPVFSSSRSIYGNNQDDGDIVSITCGFSHSVLIDKTGTSYSFGNNEDGQLGDGTYVQSSTPVRVSSKPGYTRSFNPICYGKSLDDGLASVCSGRGICASPNNCTCETGYLGDSCEISVCFGIPSNSHAVCSKGEGVCTAANKCTCIKSHFLDFKYGDQCEITISKAFELSLVFLLGGTAGGLSLGTAVTVFGSLLLCCCCTCCLVFLMTIIFELACFGLYFISIGWLKYIDCMCDKAQQFFCQFLFETLFCNFCCCICSTFTGQNKNKMRRVFATGGKDNEIEMIQRQLDQLSKKQGTLLNNINKVTSIDIINNQQDKKNQKRLEKLQKMRKRASKVAPDSDK